MHYFCHRERNKSHFMAKYMDQSGAQHFAEALMSATKTINGQTIWGDGDITVGGGSIIEVTHSEIVNYITNSTLIPGQLYEITDYRPTAVPDKGIYYGDASWNASSQDPCTIICRASTKKSLYADCVMVDRTTKVIKYNIKYLAYIDDSSIDGRPNFDYINGSVANKGVIYWMYDPNRNVGMEYDWRATYGLSSKENAACINASIIRDVNITTSSDQPWLGRKFFPRIDLSQGASINLNINILYTDDNYSQAASLLTVIYAGNLTATGLIAGSTVYGRSVAEGNNSSFIGYRTKISGIISLANAIIGDSNTITNNNSSSIIFVNSTIKNNNNITIQTAESISVSAYITIGSDNTSISIIPRDSFIKINIGNGNSSVNIFGYPKSSGSNVTIGNNNSQMQVGGYGNKYRYSNITIGNNNNKVYIGTAVDSSTTTRDITDVLIGDNNSEINICTVSGISATVSDIIIGNCNSYICLGQVSQIKIQDFCSYIHLQGGSIVGSTTNLTDIKQVIIESYCQQIGLSTTNYDASKLTMIKISRIRFESRCFGIYFDVSPSIASINQYVSLGNICFMDSCSRISFTSGASACNISNTYINKNYVYGVAVSISSSNASEINGQSLDVVLAVWSQGNSEWVKKSLTSL